MLEAYNQAHEEKLKEIDMLNWYQGQYFADALMCTVCNSGLFREKSTKPHEYPRQPYLTKAYQENKPLTEEEKIAQTKALFSSLEIMAVNSRLDEHNN